MTKEQVIAWSDQADEYADKALQCKGEFHPDWHEVRDVYFATLVRNAALEEAAKAAVNAVASNGGIVRMEVHVHQAIRNLKEPTP